MNIEEREARRKNSVVGSMISTKTPDVEINDDDEIIQRGYYVTKKLAREIKLRAAIEDQRDSVIVQRALNAYFGFNDKNV